MPDGSTVKLNAGTQITFPENFKENRKITLSGEAFFSVKKDSLHPFVITTEALSITVLGTSFNVSSYEEEKSANVAVESGLVKVEERAGVESFNPILLNPQELLTYNKLENKHLTREFDPLEIAWKDSVLHFADADFQEVIRQIERWYGFKIDISENDLARIPKNINGTFKNKPLEKVLSGLQYTLNIAYEIDYAKKIIFITKK